MPNAMPSRFVEVVSLSDAALQSTAIAYIRSMNFSDVEWVEIAQKLSHWPDRNGTDLSQMPFMRAPRGTARWLVTTALVMLFTTQVVVRVVARRAVATHGHAHAE